MAVTLQDLTDIWYDILREEEDTSAYPLSFMQQLMNTSSLRIASWSINNPFTWMTVQKWVLPFLRTEKFYSSVQPTTLSSDVTVWATTINVWDTTNYPNTWYLYVWWFITPYTWKTSTSFTWCTAMPFAFLWWMQVSIAYLLPTDYASPVNVTYNQKAKLEAMQYDDVFEMLNWEKLRGNNMQSSWYTTRQSYNTIKPFYTIKDATYMLVYQTSANWLPIMLRYEKTPTTMSLVTDPCFIPNDTFAKATIPYLAIGEMLYNRWEEERASQLINFALWQIKEMYKFYNNTTYEEISWVQYRTAKSPRTLNI